MKRSVCLFLICCAGIQIATAQLSSGMQNLASGSTVIASSIHQTYFPSNMVDDKIYKPSEWSATSPSGWFVVDLGDTRNIRQIKLYPDVDLSRNPDKRNGTVVFSIEGSNDLLSWNTIVNPAVCSVVQGDLSKYYTSPDLNLNYRFLRVASISWAGWFAVYEFQVYGYSVQPRIDPPVVSLAPFSAGKTLLWETSAAGGQNGSLLVTSVDGMKFTLEQVNAKNQAAGVTRLDGEFKDGQIYIYNRQWNEIWLGTVSNGIVSGKINGAYTFRIFEGAVPAAPAPVAVSTAPFLPGKTLRWETSAAGGQNGTLVVTAVNGLKFNLEQVNAKNRAAGVTRMDGEFKDGQIYIYNRQWNEIWLGTLSNGVLAGKINGVYTFRIFE